MFLMNLHLRTVTKNLKNLKFSLFGWFLKLTSEVPKHFLMAQYSSEVNVSRRGDVVCTNLSSFAIIVCSGGYPTTRQGNTIHPIRIRKMFKFHVVTILNWRGREYLYRYLCRLPSLCERLRIRPSAYRNESV